MHLSGKPPSKQGIPIKIVVDDNVDRFGVEVLWGMKLTNTNYLIDLITMCMFNLIIGRNRNLQIVRLKGIWINDGVIIAFWSHPIPFRTRTWNKNTPMVLQLKLRKSRSLPNLLYTRSLHFLFYPFSSFTLLALDFLSRVPFFWFFLMNFVVHAYLWPG